MICSRCRRALPTGATSCPECGAPRDDLTTHTAPEVEPGADPPRRVLPRGTVLASRYGIAELAGRGGMGEVYRAHDLKLDQTVALKFLPEEISRDTGRLDMLVKEARIARQVSHPNVCRVYDIGESGPSTRSARSGQGRHFLSMEWIEGEDLASILRSEGRMPRDRALQVARQLCAGLAAAHERGVLHRDLKPANVMIDERGVARITDFGLAEVAAAVHGRKALQGTPHYMSPEQLAGEKVTSRSDIYALGLVLHEIFTGKPAFPGADTLEEVTLQRRDPPPAPSRLAPDLDPEVDRVILRCLDPDPARRPADADAVAQALPGGDAFAAAQAAAQQRADRIAAYRDELAELRRAGLVKMTEDERTAVERYHEGVLTDLAQQFDVDVTERGKQLSLGMRVVSLLGALALSASAFYFFYSIWGIFSVPVQVGILVAAPVAGLLLTAIAARREQSGYFTAMAGLLGFACLIVDTEIIAMVFNLSPSVIMLLAWGVFALLLAYAYGLRLLLAAGLLVLSFFVAGTFNQWGGGFWPMCLERPENFFLPAALTLVFAELAPGRRHLGFAQVHRLIGLVVLLFSIFLLSMNGAWSYLPLSHGSIEIAYQLLGFAGSAGAIWIGISRRRRESVYCGAFFFVLMLLFRFIDWWWDWMPRYLFFLIVALTAVAVVLVLKRLRAAASPRPKSSER